MVSVGGDDELGGVEHPTLSVALDWKFVEDEKTKVALIPGLSVEFEGLPLEVDWRLGIPIGVSDAADDWGAIMALEVEL